MLPAEHPLAGMFFSQRTLLAELDVPPTSPQPVGPCPPPEPEPLLASGRVSPVLDDGWPAAEPSWAAAVGTPPQSEGLGLGTELIAVGSASAASALEATDLPFNLLGVDTDLGGALFPPAAEALVQPALEMTEGFLRRSPPRTPERRDGGGGGDGWQSQSGGRGRTPPSAASSTPSSSAVDHNRFSALASLSTEQLPGERARRSPGRRSPSPGQRVPHYTSVSPDRSARRGSRGSVSSVEDDMDADLPAAHFVSSTDTMSQIFTLPYMDSEVSIVLHRVGGMLVMEGTLNGSELGSGNVDGRVGGGKGGGGMLDADELASNFMYFSSGSDAAAPSGDGHTLHSAGAHSASAAPSSDASAARFRHKFMWEFQDYGLLLGSDMIVFSNAKHPKFSMQLHDVDQEVSSLACLELWMNNVFQSIPETGICCHKDGFVQGYKLMKTNELPALKGSGDAGFRPAAVMESGASILKFLHTNCEKEGATYWLHRSASDGSLQLFEVPLGAETDPDAAESATPKKQTTTEQQQQLSVSVATLCFRMAERFAGEDGVKGSARQGIGERRLRLYRRVVELIDSVAAPQLWASATEQIAAFQLSPLDSLDGLTLHAARRISAPRDERSRLRDQSAMLVSSAVEALVMLRAARDVCATLSPEHSESQKEQQAKAKNEQMLRRLTLRLAHICLWLGQQCLAVGCVLPTTPPNSPRKETEAPQVEPDVGAGLHQFALASWLLQEAGVPAEPSSAEADGRRHVVALLTLTGRAFADLAQAGAKSGQLNGAAGPAVVKLAAAQAAAGLRGDDAARFSVAALLGLDDEAVAVATSSGGWLDKHVHAAAAAPGVDAEQNFNQAVQFLLRALRLCAPAPDGDDVSRASSTSTGGAQKDRADDRSDGGKKRTAPFTGGASGTSPAVTKELVVVPGQGRNDLSDGSEAVGTTISTALGAVYHALGDHYMATGRRTKAHRHCQQGITLFNSISDRPNAALCMAATGEIVRSSAVETDSERSFSSAAVDIYTSALRWHRQAREMLQPRSSYPRTWRKLRPDLAATAAASAALLQTRLPQLVDQQRDEAELEILSALGDASSAYRDMLAETERGAGALVAAWLEGEDKQPLRTAEGAQLAAKLGDLEHQLGLLHGWRAAAAPVTAEDARGRRLRKLALTQAEKHLSEAVRWLLLAAASSAVAAEPAPDAAEAGAYPQADAPGLRKHLVGLLAGMQKGGDDKAEAAAFKRIVQLSVRASVEMSHTAQPARGSPQLPSGAELLRQTSGS